MNVLRGVKRVAVGVSGGVDSAVAALLLKKQNDLEPVGVFMRNWDLTNEIGYCTVEKDLEDAARVCRQLNIHFHEVNFVKEYWNNVFDELLSDYQRGVTPNPDILCNKYIKFNHFLDHCTNSLECEVIATGHYARILSVDDGAKLLRATDQVKDQTFFLSQIPQRALIKSKFPLGNMLKQNVKRVARENHLEEVSIKKESVGICFIGARKFQDFISEYIKPENGVFIDVDTAAVVGEHSGKHNWTIGQRCKIGGVKDRYYIARKTDSQDIYVAQGHNHPFLYSCFLTTEPMYWIHRMPKELESNTVLQCYFRFQHGKPLVKCSALALDEGRLQIILEQPLRALTPGQYAVFYKDEECLGSGRIAYVGPSLQSLLLED